VALTVPERDSRVAADGPTAESVEDAFERVSAAVPEGWRVELIEGEIHVMPAANGEHEEIVSEAAEQVTLNRKDKGLRTYTNLGLLIPGASPTGRVIPDLVIAPKGSFADGLEYHHPDPVLLVGEVTSYSTARNDHGPKLRSYARAGIPCYLLIDRKTRIVTVYATPEGEHYTEKNAVPFSGTITLPEPLGFDLDTSEF
jgi:Uma2 family endonuclease